MLELYALGKTVLKFYLSLEYKTLLMHKSKLAIFCFFCFIVDMTFAQLPQGEIAGSEIINISSAVNNQNYILYVKLPSSYKENIKPIRLFIFSMRNGVLYRHLKSLVAWSTTIF